MKSSLLLVCGAVAIAITSYGQSPQLEAPITLEELNRRHVVGTLGLPLGTPAKIVAEVVSGDSLQQKRFASRYLLKVTHVDGKELHTPPVMQFFGFGLASAGLADNHFSLYEMTHGTKSKSLDSSQIAELEQGYVGKKVRLLVYELGGFSGIPSALPKDALTWADVPFGFGTSLRVLSDRDAEQKAGRTKR